MILLLSLQIDVVKRNRRRNSITNHPHHVPRTTKLPNKSAASGFTAASGSPSVSVSAQKPGR